MRRSSIVMRCGARPTAASMAGIFCPRKPSSPSPLRSMRSASTARCFWRSRIPRPDFKLFGPVAREATGVGNTGRAFALRLRPNQDFAGALEGFCRQRGILQARIRGGVGSIIGARFADGTSLVPFATELAIGTGVDRAGRGRYAGGAARYRAGRLSRRPRRRAAGARRQSGADDDGAGGGGAGGGGEGGSSAHSEGRPNRVVIPRECGGPRMRGFSRSITAALWNTGLPAPVRNCAQTGDRRGAAFSRRVSPELC